MNPADRPGIEPTPIGDGATTAELRRAGFKSIPFGRCLQRGQQRKSQCKRCLKWFDNIKGNWCDACYRRFHGDRPWQPAVEADSDQTFEWWRVGASVGFLAMAIGCGLFTRLVWLYGNDELILIPGFATLLAAGLTISILFRRGWEIVLRVAIGFLELFLP